MFPYIDMKLDLQNPNVNRSVKLDVTHLQAVARVAVARVSREGETSSS